MMSISQRNQKYLLAIRVPIYKQKGWVVHKAMKATEGSGQENQTPERDKGHYCIILDEFIIKLCALF